jgi:hypothetical protein
LSSEEELLDNALPEIRRLVNEKWKSFPNLRILIITPRHWLRVYNRHMEDHMQQTGELLILERLSQGQRGDILDYFSKVESLIKEIIQARLLGLFSENAEDFDQILQRVGFNNCLILLEDWGVIRGNLKKKIERLKKVRNQFAHSWNEYDVYYKKDAKKKPIRLADNLAVFGQDAKEVWLQLIKIYMHAEVKHVGLLISKLDDPNTIKVWDEITRKGGSRKHSEEV